MNDCRPALIVLRVPEGSAMPPALDGLWLNRPRWGGWAAITGLGGIAIRTEREETRADGAVGEVWEAWEAGRAPGWESSP